MFGYITSINLSGLNMNLVNLLLICLPWSGSATFVRGSTDPLAKPVRGKGNINQLLLTTTKDSKKKTINYQLDNFAFIVYVEYEAQTN